MMEITDEMVERALHAFYKGPPGVVRSLEQRDSYPGEFPRDPTAYTLLPTTFDDTKQMIRDVLEAGLAGTDRIKKT